VMVVSIRVRISTVKSGCCQGLGVGCKLVLLDAVISLFDNNRIG
jgi:hypothetical protein